MPNCAIPQVVIKEALPWFIKLIAAQSKGLTLQDLGNQSD